MKRITLLWMLVLALVWVAACAAPPPPAAEEKAPAVEEVAPVEVAEEKPAERPILSYASGADADSLDPQNAKANPSEAINHMIYNGVVEFDRQLNLVPGLAEELPTSEDAQTWTIKCRKGIKFHDGTDFTCADVKYMFERMQGKAEADEHTPFKANLWEPVPGIEKLDLVDDYTLIVTLKQPFAFFNNNLGHSASWIVSPEAHAKVGGAFGTPGGSDHAVGTGPFKLVEWVKGDHVTLVANDDYWRGRPKLGGVEISVVPEAGARVLGLEAGDYDLVVRVPPEEVDRLQGIEGIKVDIGQTNRALYAALNNQAEPFNDPRVRLALNYAIDKQKIVDNIYSGGAVQIPTATGPLGAGYADLDPIPYDPEKAKALLAEAGYPDGFETTMQIVQGRYLKDFEMMQEVAKQLEAVGVKVKLEQYEWVALLDAVGKGPDVTTARIFILGWSPSTAEARWALYPTYTTGGDRVINQKEDGSPDCETPGSDGKPDFWAPCGSNRTFYNNPTFDEYIAKATIASSVEERDEWLRKAQEELLKNPAAIWLVAPGQFTGMTEGLKNPHISPLELVYVDEPTTLAR